MSRYPHPQASHGSQQPQPPPGTEPPKDKLQTSAPGYPSAPYGSSPFASLLPSSFPPGTDPSIVACFQVADQDGSRLIDDKEQQRALSSYNQSFSLITVHLLMYLFTNTKTTWIVMEICPTKDASASTSLVVASMSLVVASM